MILFFDIISIVFLIGMQKTIYFIYSYRKKSYSQKSDNFNIEMLRLIQQY